MEYESAGVLHDKDEKCTRSGASESKGAEIDVKDVSKSIPQINVVDRKGGEVNMEATITPDDVIRAGGFGARDDISSFLPVASDSTDFEASIRDAQDYEQAVEQVHRPGLGWTEASKTL
ncbi:hypothetical protein ACOSP7_026815 [Xanthoceras sorbifolium]|uniref:Uncharacterized protein n=1 Tax=Xanthoceras sorbifolium TaxID=99658 RepID=A0ABQ8HF72_9ROSI|nr:hypothetical protein JRO89_XS11G0091100 [Xanthoceras sorbifolium]